MSPNDVRQCQLKKQMAGGSVCPKLIEISVHCNNCENLILHCLVRKITDYVFDSHRFGLGHHAPVHCKLIADTANATLANNNKQCIFLQMTTSLASSMVAVFVA